MGGAGTPDFFYREAQRLGYVARSAFKVACQSLGPLKNNGAVVGIDLKVCFRQNLEQKVKVPAMHCDSRVQTVCADVMKLPRDQIRDLSPQQKGFSVVLSDMCPLVSGITTRDAVLSAELGLRALNLAVGGGALPHSDDNVQLDGQSDGSVSAPGNNGALQPGGHLVIKLLESEEIKEIGQSCKSLFRKTSWLRPKATRSCSREIYLICQGLRH
nr:putative ribosomal RNA methyltransferase mrm2, mitochondrial isoform X1 [Ipomoea batatas]